MPQELLATPPIAIQLLALNTLNSTMNPRNHNPKQNPPPVNKAYFLASTQT